MKNAAILSLTVHLLVVCTNTRSQEMPSSTMQQLEGLSEISEAQVEDDFLIQHLNYLKDHPINLNTVSAEELHEFSFLDEHQIHQFMSYRKLLGDFVSVYELQSVPGWHLGTIYKILPFVTVRKELNSLQQIKKWISNGEHSFLLRTSAVLEKAKGFKTGAYNGDRSHSFMRYQYRFDNRLQYGFTADKDAGEPFFKSNNGKGFDFYSAHLFVKNRGVIKGLALGDFSVNFGQGLVHWQAMAFKKSAEVLAIKRHATVLRPYTSSGEIHFNRGVGLTLQRNHWETTLFVSRKKISGNSDHDRASGDEIFTSFLSSGLYRTVAEIKDKNNIEETSFGTNVKFAKNSFSIGLNVIQHHFSKRFKKEDKAYNLFAWCGKSWTNGSLDYGHTYKNMHFFGEAALDQNRNGALIHGVLVSAHSKLDFSFIHRFINERYQAIYGNAFTESIQPGNERGFYMGATMRPVPSFTLSAYADLYQFPWLRYRTDAPGGGKDFLLQATYKPNKQFEAYSRYRYDNKEANRAGEGLTMHYLGTKKRHNWRTHFSYASSPALTLRARADMVWYRQEQMSEKGWLIFGEVHYKYNIRLSGNLRVQRFKTDGFESRLYAFENDVLYGYSIPSFFNTGFRCYINIHYECSKTVSLWLRTAQTRYSPKAKIGSGLEQLNGNTKTELKLQALFRL